MKSEEKIRRIERACRLGMGTHVWEDFREGIVEGRYQAFDNPDGVAITELVQTPQKRYLHIWTAAGQLDAVHALEPDIERYALTNDCHFMSTIGRVGWERIARLPGWKKSGTYYTKELHHGW